MRPNTLKLSLVLALSLATLAACDKHGKKSEDAGASVAANTAAAAPATTATTTPTATTTTPATTAPATVEAGDSRKAWKEACADDLKKFCADAGKPGKCLKEHESELSQACNAARAARRAAHRAEKANKGE